jgi:hypothetical protein
MPIVWFEQHVKASSGMAQIVQIILNASIIGQIFGVISTIIGIGIVASIICTKQKSYNFAAIDKTEKNNNNNEHNSVVTQPLMRK